MMRKQLKTITLFAVAAAVLSLAGGKLHAQDRPPQGGPDMQQMRQRMMERMRTQLEVKDNSEWLIISNRVQALTKARRSLGLGGGPGGGMGGGMGGPPPGGRNGGPGQEGQGPGGGGFGPPGGNDGGTPGGPGGPGGFNREPDPELDALRKAVEGKASAAELKAKLADLKEARKKKMEAFENAQNDLRQVLSLRQEAIAATLGLL
jgi:hypothetical protein